MKHITEVTVYSIGDSSKISTWSNVPYFFTETLISKGIKVNRIDISPSRVLKKIYELSLWKVVKLIFPNSTYEYFRTFINHFHVRYRISKAEKKFGNSQLSIFLTFSFSSYGLTNKPIILFGDWTYAHYFNYFINRPPDILEKSSIKRENKEIEKADLIIPLFPSVANEIKSKYKNGKIFYFGNVINSLIQADEDLIIQRKMNSKRLLFIGSTKYLEGARCLIEAFVILKDKYPDLYLDIIGMLPGDFEYLPSDVKCYGFLDKGIDEHRQLYYSLLENSKMYINTTPKWAAFSASIEAMYFYNPVIITEYQEFVKTFGSEINFGIYCKENTVNTLCASIETILNHKLYTDLCLSAHSAVKDYTWSNYIDKILDMIKQTL